jgi:YHS domain-containing protein
MILRFLWYLLLAFLVFKLIQVLRASFFSQPKPPTQSPEGKGEKMVKDPQCGTYIPQSEALTGTLGGKTHHFCSPECRDKFLSK